jgi:DNA-binding transcriptional MerR regulator
VSEALLRSGAVSELAGVNQQTLRYYERRGLLEKPLRSSGGHRLYSEHAVTTLRIIKAAQRLGFTHKEVIGLLDTDAPAQGFTLPRCCPFQIE